MHLATAGVEVLHPVQVVAEMLASSHEADSGLEGLPGGATDGR